MKSIMRTSTRLRTASRSIHRFNNDEVGAAYTLSFVMVMPIYALLMCLIIETALMMTAKLGTVYASFAAARSATVWSSSTSWESTEKKAKLAAVKSMIPFASGTQSLFSSVPTSSTAYRDLPKFMLANEAYAEKPAARKYLMAKYGYAYRNVDVKIDRPTSGSNVPITVTVTYRFPFNVPGIGRLIGERGVDGYYFTITSKATIPSEDPRDNRKTIGIGYGTFE